MAIKFKKSLLIFLAILAIAAFFRLWQLDTIPPGLYPDEAINGNDAYSNPGQIFYRENNGREGLFMNLIYVMFHIFGVSVWSLKIIPAVLGILTVFGIYFLAQEIFWIIKDKFDEKTIKFIGLASAFFLAVSFWHVNFNRISFRANFLPFIMTFFFYFLLKGFRRVLTENNRKLKKSTPYFVLAGFIFGLGFYTYTSFRMSVLSLGTVLFCYFLFFWKEKILKNYIYCVFILLSVIFITALPIGLYFLLSHPEDFVSRATGVSVFTQPNIPKAIIESLVKNLGMFNIYGDSNWRHNFSGSPELSFPVGILFLVGFAVSIKHFFVSLKKKDWKSFIVPCLLFSWFISLLSPGFLTYEGIPHALRVIGVIPVVFLFAGLGAWYIYDFAKRVIKNENILAVICLIFALSLVYGQYDKYFVKWAGNPAVQGSFAKDFVEMGNYLNSLPDDTAKYVIVNASGVLVPLPDGIPMPAQTIMFIERTKYGELQSVYLKPDELDKIAEAAGKTVIVAMNPNDGQLFEKLEIKFPQGIIEEIKINATNMSFKVFIVDKQ